MRSGNIESLKTIDSVNYPKLAVVFFLSLAIASSWLVFPYFMPGKELLLDVGDSSRMLKSTAIARYFNRHLVVHRDLELSATFATAEFFQFVDNAQAIGNLLGFAPHSTAYLVPFQEHGLVAEQDILDILERYS